MQIGLGGNYNWQSHMESKTHECHEKIPQNKSITLFFSKNSHTTPLSRSAHSTSIPRLRSTFLSSATVLTSPDHPQIIPSTTSSIPSVTPSIPHAVNFSHLDYAHKLAHNLPLTVPEAGLQDWLASFACEPVWDVTEHESAWEMMEAAINHAIGYNMTINDVSKLIQRGRLGVEALCDWLEKCVVQFGVDECLLG